MSPESLDSMLICSKPEQEKRQRPAEQSLKCPRCESTNTKFCYYNNYSLSQPRYFCKSCRRYWTKGGTLRNVPVGGGCRKNKRSSSSSAVASAAKKTQDHQLQLSPLIAATSNNHPLLSTHLTALSYDSSSCSDLSLAFARLQKQVVGGFSFNDLGISVMGNSNSSHFDNLLESQNCGPLNSFMGSFLEGPSNNGSENLYYGNLEIDGGEEIMGVLPFDQDNILTNMKQEMCVNGGRRSGEEHGMVSWGFPYQITGEGSYTDDSGSGGGGHVLDSVRDCCNSGLANSTWHGLLNNPLM
ncbi:hypothetical protein Nepgr_014376 [Nepenthes gracilis]|uniref:Dof zinc finger protein n=1 Tax=Nepenthes gracilis TaxID=150966 RepID=A0AAD3SKP1_NEPGR|nr:hypothetical protein Nepgr_014376 [Nepenthes gracilis]